MNNDFSKAFDNLRTCVDGVACWSGISSWCEKQRNCTECKSNVSSHMEALYDAHNHDTTEYRDAGVKLTMLQRALSKDYGINAKWDGLRHAWSIETDTTQRQDELRAAWHEGYTAAMHARATETWQLDRERSKVVQRLRNYDRDNDTLEQMHDVLGVKIGQCIITRLIELLGGDRTCPNDDETCPNAVQRSSITDRKKVVRKLKDIRFDGGSHENLAKIAYAIYPCATGWTCESCEGLRDLLVRLIGRDDGGTCVSGDVCRRARADGAARDSGELAEVERLQTLLDETNEQLDNALDKNRILRRHIASMQGGSKRWREKYRELKHERDHYERERDHWHQQATDLMNRADDMEHKCDELQAECDRLTAALDELHADPASDAICRLERQRDELQKRLRELETFDPDTAFAAFGDDNDELRKLLSRVAQLLTQAKQDRDINYANWMDCKEKVLQKIITIDERDRYKDACEAAQSLVHDMMDGLEDYIELPKDANVEHVRPGDTLTDGEHTFVVDEVAYDGERWSVRNYQGITRALCDVHHVSEEEE